MINKAVVGHIPTVEQEPSLMLSWSMTSMTNDQGRLRPKNMEFYHVHKCLILLADLYVAQIYLMH